MNMRTVVFDLDGTLADTSGDLLAAANAVFSGLGHGNVLDGRDTLVAFQGGRAMLQTGSDRLNLGWTKADIDRLYPSLLAAYADAIDVYTTLYPGAVDAVQALLDTGHATAICTNKPEALAETLLQRLGVRHLFGAMIGADTLATRKPDAAPYAAAVERAGGTVARSVLIGDTETDRLTGTAAGVPVVLVTFGPEGAGVARLKPEALMHHFDDLGSIVARIFARIDGE